LHFPTGEKKSEERKEEKKGRKRSENKKGSGCACSSAFVAAITLALSAAACVVEGWARAAVHDGIICLRICSTNKGERKNKVLG